MKTTEPHGATQREPESSWLSTAASALVFLLTALVFSPVLRNAFVNWDDDWNLLENVDYRGLAWSNLRWMFTSFHTGHYQPLTWFTFGIDYTLWGMNPLGYHLTNLLFHSVNGVLVYFLCQRIFSLFMGASIQTSGIKIAAVFTALFFALHPLRVESVAWATERRDVLSGCFLLAALLCYLRIDGRNGQHYWRWWSTSFVCFALSLLAKATGLGLPIVFLILDVYPLRRFVKNQRPALLWLEKVPFLLLSIAAAALAIYSQQETRAGLKTFAEHGLAGRAALSAFALVFYIWKTILPQNLSPLYAIPADFNAGTPEFILCGFVVLIITIVLFGLRKKWPAGLIAWLCYVVMLAPVSGLAQSGPQIAADRYSYVATIPWAMLAGAGLCWLPAKVPLRATLTLSYSIAALIVFGLGWATWRQTFVWRNSENLWRHALSTGYESGLAHNNLAVVLIEQSKPIEAIAHLRRALEINEAYADGHFNLAKALEIQGDAKAALPHLARAAELNASNPAFQAKLGLALAQQGALDQAKKHLEKAILLNPGDAKAHNNLGNVLSERGENSRAIGEFQQALKLDPALRGIHMNLAVALMRERRLDEAANHFQEMLKTTPNFVPAIFYLGVIAGGQGDLRKATEQFKRAIELRPDFADAHAALARALARQGKIDEAMKHYQQALALMKSQRDKQS